MSNFGVYIIQSERNGRYYIGCASDHEHRLLEHNNQRVKATKNLVPWTLKIFLPCSTFEEARKAEYRLKSYKRRDILEKVIQSGIFPWEHNKGR